MRTTFLLLSLALFQPARADEPGVTPAADAFRRVISRINGISAKEMYMKASFRIEGEMTSKSGLLRMQRSPLKVYFRQDYPDEGLEIIYQEGKWDGKALVWPNAFPWVNLKLDPQGSLMRKNSHHSLFEGGYWYLGELLDHELKTNEDAVLSNEGWVDSEGGKLVRLSMQLPGFGFRDYHVGEGEDVIKIAKKLRLSDYMIVERNREVDDFWDVTPGQSILVPRCYASRMVLLVDPATWLPGRVEIYDDRGLYEVYEYKGVKVNPVFTRLTFSEENPEYGF